MTLAGRLTDRPAPPQPVSRLALPVGSVTAKPGEKAKRDAAQQQASNLTTWTRDIVICDPAGNRICFFSEDGDGAA